MQVKKQKYILFVYSNSSSLGLYLFLFRVVLLMESFEPFHCHKSMPLKIADFDDLKEHDHTATMSGLRGTWPYMAPEVLADERFSKGSDVWRQVKNIIQCIQTFA